MWRSVFGPSAFQTRSHYNRIQRKIAGYVWVKSHLSLEAFRVRFGGNLDWAYAANCHADEAAGERGAWLKRQAVYSTYWDINRWHDRRLLQVQTHLLPRVSVS